MVVAASPQIYILQRSCHHNPEPINLNPEPINLNPEPRTLNNKLIIMISVTHNEYHINAHLFISFIKTMIDTNSYRLLILRLSLVKIVLSNAKSASE